MVLETMFTKDEPTVDVQNVSLTSEMKKRLVVEGEIDNDHGSSRYSALASPAI